MLINNFYFYILTIFLTGCSVLGIRSGYESLGYKVIEKIGKIEIRQYPTRIVAEVINVKTDNEAFLILFRYISGENITKQDISMTTPVEVSKKSSKIAMTTPVEVSKSATDDVTMRFFLPRTFTVDSVPKPNDSRIKVVSIPEETFAAITYSGFDTEESFKEESDRLINTLSNSNWKPVAMPSFLGYDPPFTIPFLRKNEAIIKVEAKS